MHGKRYSKNSVKQKFHYKNCKKTFVKYVGFKKILYDSRIILAAISLYSKDSQSLSKIVESIQKQFSIKVARQTVLNWFNKYSEMVND